MKVIFFLIIYYEKKYISNKYILIEQSWFQAL